MIYITNSFITWNLLIRNASETRRRLRWKVCSKTTYGQCQPPGDLICWQNADSRSHLRSKPVYTHGLPLIGFRTNVFTVQKKPTYCQKNKSTLQEPVYYPTLFETKKNCQLFREKKTKRTLSSQRNCCCCCNCCCIICNMVWVSKFATVGVLGVLEAAGSVGVYTSIYIYIFPIDI